MARKINRSKRNAEVETTETPEETIEVRCGCGWGRLRCPESEVPQACPLCGAAFDREIFVEDEVIEEAVDGAVETMPNSSVWGLSGVGDTRRRRPMTGPFRCERCTSELHGSHVCSECAKTRNPPRRPRRAIPGTTAVSRTSMKDPNWVEKEILETQAEIGLNFPMDAYRDVVAEALEHGSARHPTLTKKGGISAQAERTKDGEDFVYLRAGYAEVEIPFAAAEAFAAYGRRSPNPRARRLTDYGSPLDMETFKTHGRGSFRVDPLAGYQAVEVTPWERGLPQDKIRATHVQVSDVRDLAGNPRSRGFPARRNGHSCPPNGTDQRGRCVGLCDQCGEHGLVTGRYTSYCPSCQTCEACGCPGVDGFSHYEGCRFAPPGNVAHLTGQERGVHMDRLLPPAPTPMIPNGARRNGDQIDLTKLRLVQTWVVGTADGYRAKDGTLVRDEDRAEQYASWAEARQHARPGDVVLQNSHTESVVDERGKSMRRNIGVKSISGQKFIVVQFDPSTALDVRRDVEKILEIAGIRGRGRSEQAEGAVRLSYAIPATHDPVVVAAALKKFFRSQKDVRVSVG